MILNNMGKIIKVNPRLILPTQPRLEGERFERALKEFKESGIMRFSPFPCMEYSDNYAAIDGHSRTTIATLVNEEIRIYIPENREDLMHYSDFPNTSRESIDEMNYHIQERYHSISRGLLVTIRDYNIRTFNDLIQRNREMVDSIWNSVFSTNAPSLD